MATGVKCIPRKFISDILPKIGLISLPKDDYKGLTDINKKVQLDFDDLYQYSLCKKFNLKLVTMDLDFRKVRDIEIQFL